MVDDGAAPSAATEENEVAGLQRTHVGDERALRVLLARRALEADAQLVEDVTGEARAVEGGGAAGADAVTGADMALGGADEVAHDGVEDDVVSRGATFNGE